MMCIIMSEDDTFLNYSQFCITKQALKQSITIHEEEQLLSQFIFLFGIINARFTGPVNLTDFKLRNEISQKP